MTESLSFNDLKINDESSRIILVKLIFLINKGERFSDDEIELLYFRITKLFQSSNVKLRQMTYKSLKVIDILIFKMIMPSKYYHLI